MTELSRDSLQKVTRMLEGIPASGTSGDPFKILDLQTSIPPRSTFAADFKGYGAQAQINRSVFDQAAILATNKPGLVPPEIRAKLTDRNIVNALDNAQTYIKAVDKLVAAGLKVYNVQSSPTLDAQEFRALIKGGSIRGQQVVGAEEFASNVRELLPSYQNTLAKDHVDRYLRIIDAQTQGFRSMEGHQASNPNGKVERLVHFLSEDAIGRNAPLNRHEKVADLHAHERSALAEAGILSAFEEALARLNSSKLAEIAAQEENAEKSEESVRSVSRGEVLTLAEQLIDRGWSDLAGITKDLDREDFENYSSKPPSKSSSRKGSGIVETDKSDIAIVNPIEESGIARVNPNATTSSDLASKVQDRALKLARAWTAIEQGQLEFRVESFDLDLKRQTVEKVAGQYQGPFQRAWKRENGEELRLHLGRFAENAGYVPDFSGKLADDIGMGDAHTLVEPLAPKASRGISDAAAKLLNYLERQIAGVDFEDLKDRLQEVDLKKQRLQPENVSSVQGAEFGRRGKKEADSSLLDNFRTVEQAAESQLRNRAGLRLHETSGRMLANETGKIPFRDLEKAAKHRLENTVKRIETQAKATQSEREQQREQKQLPSRAGAMILQGSLLAGAIVGYGLVQKELVTTGGILYVASLFASAVATVYKYARLSKGDLKLNPPKRERLWVAGMLTSILGGGYVASNLPNYYLLLRAKTGGADELANYVLREVSEMSGSGHGLPAANMALGSLFGLVAFSAAWSMRRRSKTSRSKGQDSREVPKTSSDGYGSRRWRFEWRTSDALASCRALISFLNLKLLQCFMLNSYLSLAWKTQRFQWVAPVFLTAPFFNNFP